MRTLPRAAQLFVVAVVLTGGILLVLSLVLNALVLFRLLQTLMAASVRSTVTAGAR